MTQSPDTAAEKQQQETQTTAEGGAGATQTAGGADLRQQKTRPYFMAIIFPLILVGTIMAVSAFFIVIYPKYIRPSNEVSAQATAPVAGSTEWQFHRDVAAEIPSGNLGEEWRSARAAHKIIAYTVARCLNVDVEKMRQNTFDSLLLDLRPNGDHFWNTPATLQNADQNGPSAGLGSNMGYAGSMLALSDAVARARLAAVAGAENFYPDMFHFGWAAVVISALATMVVTLKASLGKETHVKWSFIVGFSAIMLSTSATVLTGAKQFWDPTNAYMRNETALLALKQLHEEMALTFAADADAAKCKFSAIYADDLHSKLPRWRSAVVSLQSGTMPAPVIISTQNSISGQGLPTDEVLPTPPGKEPEAQPPAPPAPSKS